MMKKYLLFAALSFLICKYAGAQNLVPNGDFEQYSGCPDNTGQFDSVLFWITAGGGVPITYYNQCTFNPDVSIPYNISGYQPAFDGSAYTGIQLANVIVGNYR